ncbi:MAG: pyridoxamine 5'-phosphate oxidase [Actinomycetes bacterium]
MKLDTSMSEIDRAAIRDMRRSYGEAGLEESKVAKDPIAQFHSWLTEAAANAVIVEANAMVLSTVVDSYPTSRTVLLKDVTESGFSFFSNYESGKGKALDANPNVSLVFPWYAMERQVIILGSVTKLPAIESDEYFATRPWGSQIGAWASAQSTQIESREVLEASFAKFAEKYPEGSVVPRPDHWGGYLVTPTTIEFWQGRYSRMHDRLRYVRATTNSNWSLTRLNP